MQPPVDRSVSPLLSRARPATNSKKEAPESAESGLLGVWKGGQFEFSSPLAEARWEREAYRQAVNSETWHKGRVVDPDTKALIDAKVAGPSHAIYQGPDGEHRFFDPGVTETADVHAIRMRNFTGKTWAELNASRMPGEDEAAAYHAAKRAENAAPSAKESAANLATPASDTRPGPSIAKWARDPRDSATSNGSRTDAFFPDRKPAWEAPAPGPVLAADFGAVPNAPGVGPIPGLAPRPAVIVPEAVPAPSRLNGMGAAFRQGVGFVERLESQSQNQSAEPVGKSIDAAVEVFVDPAYRAATQRLLDDRAYANPDALAEQLKEAIDWNVPLAAQAYLSQPGVETGYTLTAAELDAVSQSLRDRTLDLLPADRRSQVESAWADHQSLIIKDGPVGLDTTLQALQRSSRVEVFVNGELAISVDRGAAEMRGGPDIKLLNEITARKAKAFAKACQGFTEVSHVGGAVNEKGDSLTESYIQNIADRLTTKGSRYMDVTIQLEIDGEPCSFHINTADITSSEMFTDGEWQALNDAATIMRNNGATWDQVTAAWSARVTLGVISKMNAFLALPKPSLGHRSKEEMEQAVDDFLKMLSCADIEAACKENAVINKGRGSDAIH